MEPLKTEVIKNELSLKIDREDFALSLKTWRLRQGLTQKEVAKEWGVSRHTIMRAELAKPITWEMAYRLFAKLSTSLKNEQEK